MLLLRLIHGIVDFKLMLMLICLETPSSTKEKVDFTIVFAGITGAGKSSAGNFFLNKKVFQSEKGLLAVTHNSKPGTATIHGKTIRIIDTPGFFDGFKSPEESFRELSRALTLAKDGVHAVAFVMNYNRYTTTCEEALKQLAPLKGMQSYLFVLLTQTEDEGVTKEATDLYVRECLSSPRCPNGLKDLIQKVDGRVIMVESKIQVKDNYHDKKSKELIEMVESIFKNNNNEVYTNSMLRLVAQAYEIARQHQAKEDEKTKRLLRSNLHKIEQLQKQINDSAIAAKNKPTDKASNEIAELIGQNEKLEKHLEEVKSEAYLEDYTGIILKRLMKQNNIKAKNLSEIIKLFAVNLTVGSIITPVGAGTVATAGGIVGGGIGATLGTVVPGAGTVAGAIGGAQVGATIGGIFGAVSGLGLTAKGFYDDCKQQ